MLNASTSKPYPSKSPHPPSPPHTHSPKSQPHDPLTITITLALANPTTVIGMQSGPPHPLSPPNPSTAHIERSLLRNPDSAVGFTAPSWAADLPPVAQPHAQVNTQS
ncbi:hypothetical protein Vretimale_18128 [Volvox reticuliferus]|uniref:Uncharacterized protein n=1 Tax=Volvox reticuliferus TaxID=1737510 RepID=A0A8J4GUD7_9CHLO|nr:hypothetical protein Vretimale_18128 [Volvox reticuliferus]